MFTLKYLGPSGDRENPGIQYKLTLEGRPESRVLEAQLKQYLHDYVLQTDYQITGARLLVQDGGPEYTEVIQEVFLKSGRFTEAVLRPKTGASIVIDAKPPKAAAAAAGMGRARAAGASV